MLAFKASGDSGHDFADSFLRVRISGDAGSVTLFEGVIVNRSGSLDYREIELDISQFAGQTVTVIFEQSDNGDHLHEHVYLDDIEIRTSD